MPHSHNDKVVFVRYCQNTLLNIKPYCDKLSQLWNMK